MSRVLQTPEEGARQSAQKKRQLSRVLEDEQKLARSNTERGFTGWRNCGRKSTKHHRTCGDTGIAGCCQSIKFKAQDHQRGRWKYWQREIRSRKVPRSCLTAWLSLCRWQGSPWRFKSEAKSTHLQAVKTEAKTSPTGVLLSTVKSWNLGDGTMGRTHDKHLGSQPQQKVKRILFLKPGDGWSSVLCYRMFQLPG